MPNAMLRYAYLPRTPYGKLRPSFGFRVLSELLPQSRPASVPNSDPAPQGTAGARGFLKRVSMLGIECTRPSQSFEGICKVAKGSSGGRADSP
jgi:hypothetical protein